MKVSFFQRIRLLVTLIIGACALASIVGANPVVLHVDAKGSSDGYDTDEKAFANLQAALDKVGKGKRIGDVEIWVHEGMYPVSNSILLNPRSLKRVNSLLIRSAPGEEVVFFGGKQIPPESFRTITDEGFLSRLVDKTAGEHIRVSDLSRLGITDLGEITRHGWSMEPPKRVPPAMLTVGGKRMVLARWPNVGEQNPHMVYQHYNPEGGPIRGYGIKIQEIIQEVEKSDHMAGEVSFLSVLDPGASYRKTRNFNASGGTFKVGFDRMKYWQDVGNIFLDGVLGSTWEWTYNQIDSVDVENKTISLAGPELAGIGIGESVRLPHFHFDNIPEELDQPGEYYIDRSKGLLYYYPIQDLNKEALILSTLSEPIIDLKDVSNVRIEGITFDCGRFLGIRIDNCENIQIDGCTVSNFTKGGIQINGENVTVQNTHIHGMGAYGVEISGGNSRTLEPGNNQVLNCHMHDLGWDQKSQMPGVIVKGVGHRIAHCEIHDGTHFGIKLIRTNDVVVEYNEIYDLPNYHFFDGGSLYHVGGEKPEARGDVVRHNYFHDIPTIGVYSDNYCWGLTAYGNVFNNVGNFANRPAFMVNGGGDARVFHNVLVNCSGIFRQGVHGSSLKMIDDWKATIDRFGNGKVESTPYAKYNDFKAWLQDPSLADWLNSNPSKPFRARSYVFNNVLFHPDVPIYGGPFGGDEYGVGDKSGRLVSRNNWATKKDPGFIDYRNENFVLRKDAAVFKKFKEFPEIRFEKMGRIE